MCGCKGIWFVIEGDNVLVCVFYCKFGVCEIKEIVVYDWDGVMDD